MPTKLNLASKPFSNRSLPWVVTASIITVSLISLIFIVRAARRANALANAVQSDISALSRQEHDLRQHAQAIKQSMTAEQLQTLGAAQTLVDRKHFSWSRLFADLESALPGNVRVKRIAVREIVTRANDTLAGWNSQWWRSPQRLQTCLLNSRGRYLDPHFARRLNTRERTNTAPNIVGTYRREPERLANLWPQHPVRRLQ